MPKAMKQAEELENLKLVNIALEKESQFYKERIAIFEKQLESAQIFKFLDPMPKGIFRNRMKRKKNHGHISHRCFHGDRFAATWFEAYLITLNELIEKCFCVRWVCFEKNQNIFRFLKDAKHNFSGEYDKINI